MASERWLPVVGWESYYEVSNRGRVRGLRHRWGLRPEPLVLTPKTACRDGKLRVILKAPGRKPETKLIHRLVLEAHAGPCPEGMESLHGPGGSHDNRWPENLSWGTHQQNTGPDKVRDGTSNRGEQSPSAKLTVADVEAIRRRRTGGESQVALAREFGVGPDQISRIVNGQRWSWLPRLGSNQRPAA